MHGVTHINIYEYFLPKFYPNVSFNVIMELFLLFAEDTESAKNGELRNVRFSNNNSSSKNSVGQWEFHNVLWKGDDTGKKCASEYNMYTNIGVSVEIPFLKIWCGNTSNL